MRRLQTSPVKTLAKRLTRSTIPINPTASVSRIVRHALQQPVSTVAEIRIGRPVNRVFRVECGSRTVLARIQFYRDFLDRYRHEESCMDIARQLGLNVPMVLAVGRWHTHSYMIQEYVGGKDHSDVDRSESWRVLGRLGRELEARPWPTTQEKWNRRVESVLKWVSHGDLVRRSGFLSTEELNRGRTLIARLADLPTDHVFQHGDLRPTNLILDWKDRFWLVDWGSAGGGLKLQSLTRAYCTLADDRDFKAFMNGYGMSDDDWDNAKLGLRPLMAAILLQKIFNRLRINSYHDVPFFASRLREIL